MNPAKRRFGSAIELAAVSMAIAAATVIACPLPHGAMSSDETPYMAENHAAMDRMMVGMAITPSGDVDRDFVAMMVPHHEGAVEMAQSELRYGRNEQLRRLAQEIIVTQRQEITAMRLAAGQPPSPRSEVETPR